MEILEHIAAALVVATVAAAFVLMAWANLHHS
jgi:hypothetical protein